MYSWFGFWTKLNMFSLHVSSKGKKNFTTEEIKAKASCCTFIFEQPVIPAPKSTTLHFGQIRIC